MDPLHGFPGRGPGTDAERRAARELEQRLVALGRDAETDPIDVYPNFAFAHALHALLAIVGSVLSVTQPGPGAALVLLACISTFGDLSGSFHFFRRLTGRRASQNVTSREDGGKPGVLVLVAHYDLARESAIRRSRLPIFAIFFWAMVAVLACSLLRLAGLEGLPLTIAQFIPTVVLIASIPLFADVPLSGYAHGDARNVASVLELGGQQLEHFDLWIVFTGAKEGLMLGMRAWLREHERELDPARTVVVNIDGSTPWLRKEGLVMAMRYHPDLVRLCDGPGAASRSASDGLMARARGYPAITVGADYDSARDLLTRIDQEIGPALS